MATQDIMQLSYELKPKVLLQICVWSHEDYQQQVIIQEQDTNVFYTFDNIGHDKTGLIPIGPAANKSLAYRVETTTILKIRAQSSTIRWNWIDCKFIEKKCATEGPFTYTFYEIQRITSGTNITFMTMLLVEMSDVLPVKVGTKSTVVNGGQGNGQKEVARDNFLVFEDPTDNPMPYVEEPKPVDPVESEEVELTIEEAEYLKEEDISLTKEEVYEKMDKMTPEDSQIFYFYWLEVQSRRSSNEPNAGPPEPNNPFAYEDRLQVMYNFPITKDVHGRTSQAASPHHVIISALKIDRKKMQDDIQVRSFDCQGQTQLLYNISSQSAAAIFRRVWFTHSTRSFYIQHPMYPDAGAYIVAATMATGGQGVNTSNADNPFSIVSAQQYYPFKKATFTLLGAYPMDWIKSKELPSGNQVGMQYASRLDNAELSLKINDIIFVNASPGV